jgi:hypothetical protein
VKILATHDAGLARQLAGYRKKLARESRAKNAKL